MTTELITIINELSIGADGWAQIAPFGDYAGVAMIPDGKGGFTKERAIQRLDKIAVTQMANEYGRSSRGLSGFFKKRPLYEGHPDIPVGLFHNLACRDGGLYGEPILTDDGEKLIASKTYRALSGRWAAEFVGQEDGVNIYRPVKFLSAGLTNQPNLPVQLLNEADSSADRTRTTHHAMSCSSAENPNHQPKPNMTKIIAWLSRHGITLANDATPEQVEAALAQLDPRLQTNDTRQQFANERKARIESELSRAVRDGRISESDRATWQQRLVNEAQFTNELAALEALKRGSDADHCVVTGAGDDPLGPSEDQADTTTGQPITINILGASKGTLRVVTDGTVNDGDYVKCGATGQVTQAATTNLSFGRAVIPTDCSKAAGDVITIIPALPAKYTF